LTPWEKPAPKATAAVKPRSAKVTREIDPDGELHLNPKNIPKNISQFERKNTDAHVFISKTKHTTNRRENSPQSLEFEML